jgi:hypothetical protein
VEWKNNSAFKARVAKDYRALVSREKELLQLVAVVNNHARETSIRNALAGRVSQSTSSAQDDAETGINVIGATR